MKLYNTLSKTVEDFKPLREGEVTVYSCGPTVYDHIHIGNLSAFIVSDTLRRTLHANGYKVKHVMNFTDVDDKTIRRSTERFPDISPEEALRELTSEYEDIFLNDMQAIGNDTNQITFIRATDSFDAMRDLITRLYHDGFAYITDDGVYFSIQKYRDSGKKYGQLLELTAANTSDARINNDEYDKDSVHDFALWKTRKNDEPAWEFNLDGHDLLGRPGWHIECSAMSATNLGLPFDIHTGGVDLKFPHHENEIAQSTAGKDDPFFAKYFVHNEHLLVDGRKMSKSLGNFFTLRDIQEKGYEPLAFRLMVLQGHYRAQSNFTWDSLEAANNRLQAYRVMADQRWQTKPNGTVDAKQLESAQKALLETLADELNTPAALTILSQIETAIDSGGISTASQGDYVSFLVWLDKALGLNLAETTDITADQKQRLTDRQQARDSQDWAKADTLRDELKRQNLGVRDTDRGQIWFRTQA